MKILVNEYAKSTQFHGFAIMSEASLPLMFLWGILIAFAFGLAARDFGQLVDFYQSEPTTLSVSVESNTNFFIPNPTVCMENSLVLPLWSAEQPDVYYETPPDYQPSDIATDIDRLLLSTDNLTTWNDMYNTDVWPTYRLYYYSYALLSYWTDAEMRMAGQQQSYHRKLFTDWSVQGPLSAGTIRVVYDVFKRRNASLAQLKRFVASRMCLVMLPNSLRFSKYTNSGGNVGRPFYESCSLDLVTHLSFSLVCFKVFAGKAGSLVQVTKKSNIYERYLRKQWVVRRDATQRLNMKQNSRNLTPLI